MSMRINVEDVLRFEPILKAVSDTTVSVLRNVFVYNDGVMVASDRFLAMSFTPHTLPNTTTTTNTQQAVAIPLSVFPLLKTLKKETAQVESDRLVAEGSGTTIPLADVDGGSIPSLRRFIETNYVEPRKGIVPENTHYGWDYKVLATVSKLANMFKDTVFFEFSGDANHPILCSEFVTNNGTYRLVVASAVRR